MFHADRVIIGLPCGQGQPFQNLKGTMRLAKFGRGMLFSVEQVVVGRNGKKHLGGRLRISMSKLRFPSSAKAKVI